jgi:RNA polymerase sigma factor (sigma-70 family)
VSNTLRLIESYIPSLRRYASALLRDRQEVDDLVHDCLVRALDQLHTRREDADMRAWLFAIMHNVFIGRLRQRRRRGYMEPVDEVAEPALGVRPTQEENVHTRDVIRALGSLPKEQRSVLFLVAVEDLSYAEVAEVLAIPIGTVMSRLARARERLRRILESGPPVALRSVN